MSYLTGPATSPVALLDTLMTFVAAAGWTVDAYSADGTGKEGHIHKGGHFVALRSFINENANQLGGNSGHFGSGIAIVGSTAYAPSGAWYNQAGAPFLYLQNPTTDVMTCIMPTPAGAIQNFWMFANPSGDNVVLVVLRANGVYSSLYFGTLDKPGAYSGGEYFGASRLYLAAFNGGQGDDQEAGPPASVNGFLRATVDSWTTWELLGVVTAAFGNQTPGKRAQSTTAPVFPSNTATADHIAYGNFRTRARSTRTEGLLLLPTLWLVERDIPSVSLFGGGWSYAGQVPDIFQTTSTGFVPGSTYTVSTDEYIVFPEFAIRKYP